MKDHSERHQERTSRPASRAKYDAHHSVLEKTYGPWADLRRELADSRGAVAQRQELLEQFAGCADPQRAWLLLEDYFAKLDLDRRDFGPSDWWSPMVAARGPARLEQLAILFLRLGRPLPQELAPSANLERLAEIDRLEREQDFIRRLEEWIVPPEPFHLESPRAALRVRARLVPIAPPPALHRLAIELIVLRPRSGERPRSASEIAALAQRPAHEREHFSTADWELIEWLAARPESVPPNGEPICLEGFELLRWLSRWGDGQRIELADPPGRLRFDGQTALLLPRLAPTARDIELSHQVALGNGQLRSLSDVIVFAGQPCLVLDGHLFHLLRQAPPANLFQEWIQRGSIPVHKLSHRCLTSLRKIHGQDGQPWDHVCRAHPASPQFVFQLADDVLRLRLMAVSELDQSRWQWNGLEWQRQGAPPPAGHPPDCLEDPRLEPAAAWLRRLDWFTPEPGLWVADAQPAFLSGLADAWQDRPRPAEYLGNPAFHRLFLAPRALRPQLVIRGSGIDWFSVSAEWEQEGYRLTPADLERLARATGRFVRLPDSGWVELDASAVAEAQAVLADLGLEELSPSAQPVALAPHREIIDARLDRFRPHPALDALRQRLADYAGPPAEPVPSAVRADLRPYQQAGFQFLCGLARLKLGGILADDMGLGKTVQTLAWLAWLKQQAAQPPQPSLVICPASVLHNWQREAQRFTPDLSVLVLESGAARHNLRQQIPRHDLIVTNYALLRRDLTALQKFDFRALILDEAQFIKNPDAQVTQSVKQLRADYRLALTGTPLENRLLDLWSIVDFVQPGLLGTQTAFAEQYETGSGDDDTRAVRHRRLSARLRPLLLRRLKRQVAQDLPDRIDERRDCELTGDQRKLYLAELRRSREQVFQTVAQRGLNRSRIHVLAALTRLRQICCHPQLVGSDSASGKTETLFELLEPMLAEGQKILLFSQFVQMLDLLAAECRQRQIPTWILTGATRRRQEVVQAFHDDPQPGVFLLSLRAAGTGLNLTSATYVILYDPWWNPAVEAQAIDRSHRIGQTRTVIAYRLIAPGTVEEKIWDLQQRKARTIADVLGEQGFSRSLTHADLEYLFAEA